MSLLPVQGDERCPRCGSAFHCGMHDATPCACTGIALQASVQRQLRELYTGCLCLRCLVALAAGAPLVDGAALPGDQRPVGDPG